MIKAIFLDFDGTLYSHNTDKIPDSAYYAIMEAQKNNVLVFLATGRALVELENFDCREIKFDGYVLNNGQQLLDKNLNSLWTNYITGNNKKILLDIFNEKKLTVLITSDNSIFLNHISSNTKKAFGDVGSKIPTIKEYENENIIMASFFIENNEQRDFLQTLSNNFEITWWHDYSADLISKGINKFEGINKILNYYNLSMNEVISIGDGHNDVEMVKKGGIGVAMGNSIDEVKNVADYVTSDIDNDGLLNAFKHYKVI